MKIAITEEASKDSKGKPCTVFYIREMPYVAGRSIQTTALTMDAAEWARDRILADNS
jgi:hypothetical protein